MKQYITLGNTTYFWFGSNDTSGSGGDGATPLCDVRLAGAAVDAIPVYSPTPALLSHANYPAGCYEVAIAATVGNGFAAGNTYAVFCSLTVDSQNPTGFVGSFDLKPVESNPIQLGSSAQSATDLKDLADTGYNPTTHKLAGVVLADTCTTNTDMRGTNSAITSLAAITDDKDSYKATGYAPANEYDTEMAHLDVNVSTRSSHADPSSGIESHGDTHWPTATGFATQNPPSQTLADYRATGYSTHGDPTSAIETYGDTKWTTATGFNTVVPDAAGVAPTVVEIRTEMDTNSTKMAPSQTLADYKATGFSTHADPSAGIESHGDLNWTTATGFNTVVPDAAGVAPTTTEIKDALEINGSKLDHIWETTEDDAGVRRFTANALEEAPSGTGGDATAASQTAIIGHLTGMKGGTWLETTDSLEAIRNRGDVAWTTGAGGSSPTVEEIRTEMDTNSTKMAPSQVLADYKATGFATINPPSSTLADYMADVSALALATVCTEARLARLDAAISSRSSHGDPDPSGFIDVAISSRNDTTPPTTDAIKTKIEEVGSSMAGVKAKTDNLKDSWNDPTAEACKADVSALATSTEVTDLNDITVANVETACDSAIDNAIASPTSGSLGYYMQKMFIAQVNKMVVTETNGNTEQFNDSNVTIGSIGGAITSDGTYTTRLRMVQ